MWVYLGVFIFLSFLAVAEYLTKNKIFFLFSIIILIIFSGLRYKIGYDYFSYQDFFSELNSFNLVFSGKLDAEPGYLLINFLMKKLGFNYSAFLLFYSVVSMSILGLFLYVAMPSPSIVLPYYYARFYLIRDMGQLRSSIVSLIFLISLGPMKRREHIKVILIAIVGAFFHLVALCIIPAYIFSLIVKNVNFKTVLLGIVLALSIGVLFFYPQLFVPFVPERYIGYFGPQYANGRWIFNPIFIMQLGILLGSLLVIKYKNQNFKVSFLLLQKMYLISTMLLIMFGPMATVAGRISTVFATVEIVIVPIVINSIFKNKLYFLLIYLIFCGIVFYLVFVVSGAYELYIPYTTIFSNNF